MKRRDFFKSLSAGTAALLVAPALLGKDQTYPAFDHEMLQDRIDVIKRSLTMTNHGQTDEVWYDATLEPSICKEMVKRYGGTPFNDILY